MASSSVDPASLVVKSTDGTVGCVRSLTSNDISKINNTISKVDDMSAWSSTADMHNNIYRGANLLGTGHFASIADIMTAVRAGNFDDIYVGDYIPATYTVDDASQTTNFRVAAINLLNARRGEEWGTTKPNLCLVPQTVLGTSYMNSTNTTVGGYVGSYMYTDVLPKYYQALAGAEGTPFYGYIRPTTERLSNAIDTTKTVRGYSGWTGAVSGVADYANQNLTLLSETEVFGHPGWSSCQWDEETIAVQLPMFRLNPFSITEYWGGWWLRDVASSTRFCGAYWGLYTCCNVASYVGGVRPRFFIA